MTTSPSGTGSQKRWPRELRRSRPGWRRSLSGSFAFCGPVVDGSSCAPTSSLGRSAPGPHRADRPGVEVGQTYPGPPTPSALRSAPYGVRWPRVQPPIGTRRTRRDALRRGAFGPGSAGPARTGGPMCISPMRDRTLVGLLDRSRPRRSFWSRPFPVVSGAGWSEAAAADVFGGAQWGVVGFLVEVGTHVRRRSVRPGPWA